MRDAEPADSGAARDARASDAASVGRDLIVSADGSADAPGTLERPTTLEAAISRVETGGAIYLRGGTYKFAAPIVIAREHSGSAGTPKTLSQYGREGAILDFAAQDSADSAGLAVEASNWHIIGLIVRGAASSGILVRGSHNRIERCASWATRGTGLSIVASPEADPNDWPSYNQIINSESFDNHRDDPAEDADGFAVRRAGPGNFFSGCLAHHNFGDGWDLSASAGEAPRSIAIDQSIAHSNGTLTNGTERTTGTCSGFRLGSDGDAVAHLVTRSVAYFNDAHGFTAGGNPGAIRLSNTLAFDNAKGNYAFESAAAVFTNDVSLWLEANAGLDDIAEGEDVSESNRFWRDGGSGVSTADFARPLTRPRAAREQSGDLDLEAFALAPDSALIDAGVVPEGVLPFEAWYYQGKPDLGAFETQ